MMDIIGMVAIFILGATAFNFGNDHRSTVITIFGILLETIAITYIFYKFLKGE